MTVINAYGDAGFGTVYRRYFGNFVNAFQASLFDLIEERRVQDGRPRRLLDVACGTGHLLRYFVDRGYEGLGVDHSQAMLQSANPLLSDAIEDGRVRLVQADATKFTVDYTFPFVTATFGAMNHLLEESKLFDCFCSVRQATDPGGLFIFDIQTTRGFSDANNVQVKDSADEFFVARVLNDPLTNRIVARVSGFVREPEGWQRFTNVVAEATWPVSRVLELLSDAGWSQGYAASPRDLSEPTDDPDNEDRVFVVATR